MTTTTGHKQGNEEQVASNPGVNSEPLQIVQPKPERKSMEPFEISMLIIYNKIIISFSCAAYLYTPSLVTLVTGQHTACQWLEPLARI